MGNANNGKKRKTEEKIDLKYITAMVECEGEFRF
jgi:hypothetical protein